MKMKHHMSSTTETITLSSNISICTIVKQRVGEAANEAMMMEKIICS